MTPSLKEPNGGAPEGPAVKTPVADIGDDTKLLALIAEWRVADDEHKRVVHEHSVAEETTEVGSDPDGYRRTEDAVDIVCALERRIIRDVPAETLAGLVAKLEVATAESGALSDHRKIWDAQEWSLWSCWQDAKRLAGTVVSPAPVQPDPLVALEAELRAAQAAFNAPGAEDKEEAERDSEYQHLSDLRLQIAESPASTLAGVMVKIHMLFELMEMGGGSIWDAALQRTITEPLNRLAGGVLPLAPASPDPVPELVRKYIEARTGYIEAGDAETAEAEEARDNAYDKEVLTPAEDALMAAVPTSRAGVAAILDLAVQIKGWKTELDWLTDRLVENARDAMKGGVS